MSQRLKLAVIAALAAFITAVTGYSVSPDILFNLCVKVGVCEVAVQ